MTVEFWLSYNSGAEKLRLPVNPPSLEVKSPFGISDVDITQLGEFSVFGERGLAEFSLSAFFPNIYNPSYCEYADYPLPTECVRIIEGWRDKRKPLRLVITGSVINYAVTIRDFSYDIQRAGSAGDIYYSLTLKEYRFIDAKKSIAVANNPKASTVKQRPPVVNKAAAKMASSYTIKTGDTLSKVFGKDWRKVYEANRKTIGANPNKIAVGMKLVIPK